MLNLSLPTLDQVVLYSPTGNGSYSRLEMGENLPFNQRKYKEPHYLFDITLPKGKIETYYLQVSSKEGIQLPLLIGTKTEIFNYYLTNKNG